ncbi:tRNA lysidine(34) synthetase TilS [Roseibium hamelinense]|uniref:tRNA lysidine(34) synthetase TilS n=1 Tax=Roseibium hamelinense TaxID=150831 RepID=UPI001AD8D8B0|nr:tRNA lysidine(34) synthetase TilS [Roseibium hamelinense]
MPETAKQADPLSHEEIDAVFRSITVNRLAFAVSGGPDSLALLVLFNEWAKKSNWNGYFEAFTVDHQLRAGSAEEAEFVKSVCRDLDVSHETLLWRDKVSSGSVQASARDARYRLLANAMRARDLTALVLGHHLDDQVETFLDRLTRGSGIYGLGGMSRDNTHGLEGLHLLRPFLGFQKLRLMASLEERAVSWCTDPSNEDLGYKRVRLRALAARLAEEGCPAERLADTAERMRRASEALMFWLSDIWQDDVEDHPAGPVRMPYRRFARLPTEMRLKLLAQMILRVTGREAPSRLKKLEALEAELHSGGSAKAQLAGAFVELHDDHIFVWKEAGRNPPDRIALTDIQNGIWDQRFSVKISGDVSALDMETLSIGPLLSARGLKVESPDGWPEGSFSCAPAIWSKGDLIGSSLPSSTLGCPWPQGVIIERVPIEFG